MERRPTLPSVRTAAAQRRPFALDEREQGRLDARLRDASKRARARGRATLAALTVRLEREADPSAVAFASRRRGEPWFCFEQPDRGGRALAALGEALDMRAAGTERFAELAARWRELTGHALQDQHDGSHAAGPVAVGGFSFAPDGGGAPHWRAFGPASMVVPELSLARAEGGSTMTLAALVQPDDDPDQVLARLVGRAEELREEPLPLLDPAPTGRFEVLSAMPPEHYEHAVARATELIGEGRMEKIVLAREVQVHAPRRYDPAAIFGVLREEFPSCFVLCAGRGEDALIAASPELLLRREGQRVSTVALAASSRRSADPAVDAHLGEQLLRDRSYREEHAIVARRIERTLRPHSVWVAAAPEPGLAQIANIQHLATPIRAQLAEPIDSLELAGIMHPTPAVGGEPLSAAAPLIPALEGLDRGWYLGPLGWTDAAGDGEFCVTLRCALLSGALARCYAGGGIVRESVPEKELAETEVKLQALLPLLSG
jgi:salicylate biosynthesis isochorismate synthase/menaquinone-specific isochorismate synthase